MYDCYLSHVSLCRCIALLEFPVSSIPWASKEAGFIFIPLDMVLVGTVWSPSNYKMTCLVPYIFKLYYKGRFSEKLVDALEHVSFFQCAECQNPMWRGGSTTNQANTIRNRLRLRLGVMPGTKLARWPSGVEVGAIGLGMVSIDLYCQDRLEVRRNRKS